MANYIDADKLKAEIERMMDEYKPIVGGVDETTGAHIVLAKFLSFLSTLEESEKPINQDEDLNKEIKAFINEYGYEKSEDILLIAIIARHFAKWGAEHLANSNDEVVINGHKIVYDKDKDYVTMVKSEESVPNDLEEAAEEWAENEAYGKSDAEFEMAYKGYIAGAKWQEDHTPLPEDTVLFNKGVEEGRRLAEEEQADLFTIVALDAAQRAKEQMMKEAIHYVVQDDLDSHGASYNIPFIRLGTIALKPKGIGVGDRVRIIIVKED